MSTVDVTDYSGWRPRSMRFGRGSSETGPQRETKRSRLGNATDRFIYTSARGHKNNPGQYARVCAMADLLNGNKRK